MNQLNLHGTIGVGTNTSEAIAAQIDAMDQSDKLRVSFDSPGGDVLQGFSIRSKLAAYAGPKLFVVESYAGSIASYILTAATGPQDKIEITGNGYVMIHNPSVGAEGDDDELRKKADLVAKVKQDMIEGYAQLSGKSPDEIQAIMKEENYYRATEALEAGWVHAVQNRKVATPQLAALDSKLRPAADAGQKSPTPTPTEKTMAEATIGEIRAAFPQASDSFIVACLEEKLTMPGVTAKAVSATADENRKLQERIEALEAENAKLKAAGEKMYAEQGDDDDAEAMYDDDKVAAEQEEDDDDDEVEAKDDDVKAHSTAQLKAKAPKRKKPGKGSTPGMQLGGAKQEWQAAIKAHVDSGMPKARAIQLVAKENPGLRERVVAEANA